MQESAPAKALSLPEDFDIRSYITKKRAEPGQNQSVRRHNLSLPGLHCGRDASGTLLAGSAARPDPPRL